MSGIDLFWSPPIDEKGTVASIWSDRYGQVWKTYDYSSGRVESVYPEMYLLGTGGVAKLLGEWALTKAAVGGSTTARNLWVANEIRAGANAAKVAEEGKALALSNAPKGSRVTEAKFSNLYPKDSVMPGPRYELIQTESGFKYRMPTGEMRTPKGLYNFVQLDGKIYIAPIRNDVHYSGHLSLSKGKDVEYAGQLQFSQKGGLKFWDNKSGHYQPTATQSDIVNLPKNIFKPYE